MSRLDDLLEKIEKEKDPADIKKLSTLIRKMRQELFQIHTGQFAQLEADQEWSRFLTGELKDWRF